jgi:hypothetical protein
MFFEKKSNWQMAAKLYVDGFFYAYGQPDATPTVNSLIRTPWDADGAK